MASIKGSSILGIIVALIVLAILIWNVIYINNVRKQLSSGTDLKLSKTAADIIFWIDIALIVIVAIYLIYNIVVIFTSKEQRTAVQEVLTKPRTSQYPIIRQSTPPLPAPVPAQ